MAPVPNKPTVSVDAMQHFNKKTGRQTDRQTDRQRQGERIRTEKINVAMQVSCTCFQVTDVGGGGRRWGVEGVVEQGLQQAHRQTDGQGQRGFCSNKVKSVLCVAYLTLLCFNDKDQIGPGFTLAPEKQ